TVSGASPDQSPQNFAFKTMVGSAEAKTASAQTAEVFSGQRKPSLREGQIATAHGSNSGRLPVFALVIIAAASTDAKKSRGEWETFARSAKATAASTKVAPNRSLPRLPACSKKP